jgi:uncharacterized protein with FMN-binding domain
VKRAFATFVATVAGLVMLLDFKTHSGRQLAQSGLGLAASTPPTSPTPAAGSAPPSAAVSAPPTSGAPSAPPSTKPSPSASVPQATTRTVTGSSVGTRYGDVQIRLTLVGTQITDVVPLRLPDSNGVDQEIDQQVVPILVQETLTAQSANIQAVSGATYTSDGYIRSLQSALDKTK